MKRRTRSPLKGRPLREAGQGVHEQLDDALLHHVLLPMLLAGLLVFLAVMEWIRHYTERPPNPWLFTLLAIAGLAGAALWILKSWSYLKQLKQGRDGERVVGQFLERRRAKGFHVFHDVQGDGFNVDHVLIGPSGAYCVETKTPSKPVGRDARVTFDGEIVQVDGFEPDRDPVVQAKAQASWLRELLQETTGRRLKVRPVIVFPGWFVEQAPGTSREVWVLNPKALDAFLDNEEPLLSDDDVKLAAYHLSRFIRAAQ
jgi:hypothetical protein